MAAASWRPLTLSIFPTAEGWQIALYLKLRATLIALPLLLAALYLGGGLGMAWWLQREPHNRIGAADLMLPWRWSKLRDLRGQMFCAQGLEAMKRGDRGRGMFLLRRGLATHPNDAFARLTLARYLATHHFYEGVRATILPQLEYPPVPRALLEILLAEAGRADDAPTIVEATARVARSSATPAADVAWLQLQQAEALNGMGRYEDALAVLSERGSDASEEALELRVTTLCGADRAHEALKLVSALPPPPQGQTQRRLRILARAQGAGGLRDELTRTLTALIGGDPVAMEPRIFAIQQYWSAGMRDDARRELGALLRRTSARPGAIPSIVGQLSTARAPELIAVCVEEARALGQPLGQLLAVLALSSVSAADWPRAEEAFAAMFGGTAKIPGDLPYSRETLRAFIDAGARATANAEGELKAILATHRFAFSTYVVTANGFAGAERWRALQLIAEAGLRHFPRSFELQRCASQAQEKLAAQNLVSH